MPAWALQLRSTELNALATLWHVPGVTAARHHQIDWKNCGAVDLHQPGMSLLAVTNDRRLMLWTSQQEGARQLCDNLPAGRL